MSRSEAANRKEAARRAAAWADYLARYEPYDHFFTGTWRGSVSDYAAWGDFRRWVARVESRASGAVAYAAVFAESIGGSKHVHALTVGTRALALADMRSAWERGHSHAETYDPKRGARGYLAHHVAANRGQRLFGDTEVETGGNFARAHGRKPPRRRRYFSRRAGRLWPIRRKTTAARSRLCENCVLGNPLQRNELANENSGVPRGGRRAQVIDLQRLTRVSVCKLLHIARAMLRRLARMASPRRGELTQVYVNQALTQYRGVANVPE